MSLLVTGTGVLGQQVARVLVEEWGERPVVFGTMRQPAHIADLRDRATLIRGDLLSLPEVAAAVKDHDVEAIVHTAALLTEISDERPYSGIQTNVMGTVNVIAAAQLAGVKRVIMVSTLAIKRLLAEAHEGHKHTGSPYQRVYPMSKLAGGLVAGAYAQLCGIDFATVRIGAMYGPTMQTEGATAGKIQAAVRQAVHGEPINIKPRFPGEGGWYYSKDVARGAVLAARAPELPWDAIDLPPGGRGSFQDVADILHELTGVPATVEPDAELEGTSREHPLDLAAAEAIGFKPRFDLRAGLTDYLNWGREHYA
jgi:UDP-glucose 4-epimerase